MPKFKPWPRHYNFPNFYIFSPVLILLILSIYFFLPIYFFFFNIYKKNNNKKKTISIVECEAFGVKCSEYFFEPSPNELAALLIGSINLTRIKIGGNPEGRGVVAYSYF